MVVSFLPLAWIPTWASCADGQGLSAIKSEPTGYRSGERGWGAAGGSSPFEIVRRGDHLVFVGEERAGLQKENQVALLDGRDWDPDPMGDPVAAGLAAIA